MYGYERGENVIQNPSDGVTRTLSWPGKVALMYPSDYGYAADLSQCKQQLYNYNASTCTSNNWMFNSDNQWLLTPSSSDADGVWLVYSGGRVSGYVASYDDGVRPSFYLNSDASIVSGNGSKGTPYIVR